jgi:hypothetical protein
LEGARPGLAVQQVLPALPLGCPGAEIPDPPSQQALVSGVVIERGCQVIQGGQRPVVHRRDSKVGHLGSFDGQKRL